MIDTLIGDLGGIDWTDLETVTAASDKLLTALDTDRDTLRDLTDHTLTDPALFALCEHYDILDKLVLHDDPTGWRLRLHLFHPGYFDRPHNHRWTYTSRILTGTYTHTLYGTDEHLGPTVHPEQLIPRMIRTEQPGDTYTLHHSMIHAVNAHPYTASLIIRGPAVKNRFLVADRVTGEVWWQYGAATETPETAARKRMTTQQAKDCVRHLCDQGVFD
jgi:hypothetical protein